MLIHFCCKARKNKFTTYFAQGQHLQKQGTRPCLCRGTLTGLQSAWRVKSDLALLPIFLYYYDSSNKVLDMCWYPTHFSETVLMKTNEGMPNPCGMLITTLLLPAGQGSDSRLPHRNQRERLGNRRPQLGNCNG